MQPHGRQHDEVLIATLGSEPQVITLALDWLRGRQHGITHAVVVYTAPTREPIRTAFTRLKTEVSHYRSSLPPVTFHFVPIEREDGSRPADIVTEQDAGAVFRTLYRQALQAKRTGCRVHLSVAGGRKVMSVYGMAVAQMLFDEDDHLWHVLSEGQLLADKRMHAEAGDDLVMIPIPVLRWSSISPAATELALTADPYRAVQKQRAMRETEALRRKSEFVQRELTQAERELLELLVRDPMPNTQLARRLHRSPKTVANQLSAIYDKFRDRFSTARADRTILIAEFALLLAERRGEA